MDEFPRKGNNKQKAAWHDAFVERTRSASFAGDEPQRAALIRHHTSESQKYKRAYAKEVALHALKSQDASAHLAAAEAYRATGDHREQPHRELAKDPKKEGGYSPYASKRHEAAEANRLGLAAPTAQKSESRLGILVRGLLAAVELRKAFHPSDVDPPWRQEMDKQKKWETFRHIAALRSERARNSNAAVDHAWAIKGHEKALAFAPDAERARQHEAAINEHRQAMSEASESVPGERAGPVSTSTKPTGIW